METKGRDMKYTRNMPYDLSGNIVLYWYKRAIHPFYYEGEVDLYARNKGFIHELLVDLQDLGYFNKVF